MVSPSDEDRKCAMFDSLSKTASRNYYRDLLRAEKRRDKNYQEEPVEYTLLNWRLFVSGDNIKREIAGGIIVFVADR